MCQLPILLSTKEPGMSQGSATSGPIFGRRIVFYGAAEDVSEPTLLQLFSKYGEVSGLFLVRSALGLPSGCGYATMATAEQAAAAVKALQGSTECAEPGGKLGLLVVQPAAPAVDEQQEDSSSVKAAKDSRTVFFTKVPPTVTAHQLIQLFTSCGEVVHVELFTPWPGAKISKGCGLVEFARVEAAAAAVNSLHLSFTWPHSHSPLVVEWLDSKRQAANRANKLSKQNSCDGAGAPIRRAVTVPMDRVAAMAAAAQGSAAMYSSAAAGFAGASGQLGIQQQQSSRSCPLPRLQATASGGWMQSTAAWPTAGGYTYLSTTPLPQVQEQGGYYLQQQPRELAAGAVMAGGSSWWLPRQVSSGINSVASTYDNSSSVSMAAGSTLSTTSTVLQTSSADMSTGSLACCPNSNAMAALATAADDRAPYSGCQSPVAPSDTSLAVAATAALGSGRVNQAWQQLQQQNIMLLQPMSNPVDDLGNTAGQCALPPGTTAAYVAECQAQALQLSNAAATAMYTSLPSATAGITLQQQQQYQQQLPFMQNGGLYAAASQPLQQQQQWWSLQQQQQPAQAAAVEPIMAVPLSARQLQAMSAVLPEVPRLTGAKAFLSACNIGSGVQLVLSGQASAVQAAHSVVAVLLSNMGVDEPLMPAVMMQQS